jgi:hypothetical protein
MVHYFLKPFVVLALTLFPTFFQPLFAQSFAPDQLYGCWRRDAPKKIGENRIAFSDFCFRPDGTVYHVSIAPEGGGDELLDWQLIIPKDYLVIDGQTCLLFGSTDVVLQLSRCLYMGSWIRKCRGMTEDGTGCARSD